MQTEVEMRLHRCCFTGHRPEKFRKSERDIRSELEKQIKQAVADGFTTFITGMARGTDIIDRTYIEYGDVASEKAAIYERSRVGQRDDTRVLRLGLSYRGRVYRFI